MSVQVPLQPILVLMIQVLIHALDEEAPLPPTVCLNTANNTANIHG